MSAVVCVLSAGSFFFLKNIERERRAAACGSILSHTAAAEWSAVWYTHGTTHTHTRTHAHTHAAARAADDVCHSGVCCVVCGVRDTTERVEKSFFLFHYSLSLLKKLSSSAVSLVFIYYNFYLFQKRLFPFLTLYI